MRLLACLSAPFVVRNFVELSTGGMACCVTEPTRVLATLRIVWRQIAQLALDSVHAIASPILFQVLQATLQSAS
jgi:hypothetical protein